MSQFTHVANPVRVSARRIAAVDHIENEIHVCFEDDSSMILDAQMIARYIPVMGDYIVTQEDGYLYVNPRDVFERKYRAIEPNEDFDNLALSLELSGHSREIATRDQRIAELEAQLAAARSQEAERAANTALQVRAQITSQVLSNGGVRPLKRANEAVQYILTGELPEGQCTEQ